MANIAFWFVSGIIAWAVVLLAWWFLVEKVSIGTPAGCTKIGLQGKSNVIDQYDGRYGTSKDAPAPAEGDRAGVVKALHIFPIKSCRGVEMDHLKITKTGPEHDRQFSFAQYEEYTNDQTKQREFGWNKITQREYPKLVLVEPEVWVPGASAPQSVQGEEHIKNGGCLAVSFPRDPPWKGWYLFEALARRIQKSPFAGLFAAPRHSFRLPLAPSPERVKELELSKDKVKVWKDIASGIDMTGLVEPRVLQELKRFVGVTKPFKIFRTDVEQFREVHRNAPKPDDLGYQAIVGYADSYPLHILNLASVHNIASYLPPSFGHLDARRFRSNILVTGPPAHAEDAWTLITIGRSKEANPFNVTDLTTRCQLPNVDPATGTVEPFKLPWTSQPFRALARKERMKNPVYMEPLKAMRDPARANRCVDAGAKDKACLGMQMVPRLTVENGSGTTKEVWVRVGDEVVLLEKGEHFFVP